MIEIARGDVGYRESPPGSNRTKFAEMAGHLNGQPWCATWVVSVARRAHVQLPSESAYTPSMANAFRAAGLWDRTPHPNDIAFFDFPDSTTRIQHVGIVESSSDHYVTCIEGNTSQGTTGSQDNGGGVYRRTRPLAQVVGFGHLTPQHDDVDDEEMILWL